jgi:CRP-like cAMP-binding protein
MTKQVAGGGEVCVVDADPDLADRIPAAELPGARRASLARSARLAPGRWVPPEPTPGEEGFGLLLLSGFLVRRVGRDGLFGAEVLGPGDLLRPWQEPGKLASRPFESSWQTIAAGEVAVLDGGFVERVAPYPQIGVRLVDRAMLRSRHLALGMAVVQQRRVDQRLETLFWLLADRWGRMTRDGVRVVAPLTHALLAELVAARRPSVSAALGELAERGRITRAGDEWILRSDD